MAGNRACVGNPHHSQEDVSEDKVSDVNTVAQKDNMFDCSVERTDYVSSGVSDSKVGTHVSSEEDNNDDDDNPSGSNYSVLKVDSTKNNNNTQSISASAVGNSTKKSSDDNIHDRSHVAKRVKKKKLTCTKVILSKESTIPYE